jgi:Glycosyl transferase family 2
MLRGKRIAVVLPAYNAESTLRRTVAELDRSIVDDLVLVDDASTNATIAVAEALDLDAGEAFRKFGSPRQPKTCYRTRLGLGAEIVVMVQPTTSTPRSRSRPSQPRLRTESMTPY